MSLHGNEATDFWIDPQAIDPKGWMLAAPAPQDTFASAVFPLRLTGVASATLSAFAFSSAVVSLRVNSAAPPAPRVIPLEAIRRLPRPAPRVHRLPSRPAVGISRARVRTAGRKGRGPAPVLARGLRGRGEGRAWTVLLVALVGLYGSFLAATGGVQSQTKTRVLAQPGGGQIAPR